MASEAQQADRDPHVSGEPENLLSIEAAKFLAFDRTHRGEARTPRETMRLFREWAKRKRVPHLNRGRTLLYERRVLLAFLKLERWTLNRHAETVGVSPTGRKTKTVTGKSLRVVGSSR
jgi:hypothetical protein